MVAAALKIPLNLRPLNLQQKEHLLPEFIKINPQKTVPTLVDNDFSVWESRAICIYLVEKYAYRDDSLYPKDPKRRAVVNQRLYFDMGVLSKRLYDFLYPQLVLKEKQDVKKLKSLEEAVELLDIFLEENKFLAGDKMTIADFSVVVTASVIELTGFEIRKYPSICRWYDEMKETCPGWSINEEGLNLMKEKMKN